MTFRCALTQTLEYGPYMRGDAVAFKDGILSNLEREKNLAKLQI